MTCLLVAEEITGSKFGFLGAIGPDGLLNDIAISNFAWERCEMRAKNGHVGPPTGFKIQGLYGRVLSEGKGFFSE